MLQFFIVGCLELVHPIYFSFCGLADTNTKVNSSLEISSETLMNLGTDRGRGSLREFSFGGSNIFFLAWKLSQHTKTIKIKCPIYRQPFQGLKNLIKMVHFCECLFVGCLLKQSLHVHCSSWRAENQSILQILRVVSVVLKLSQVLQCSVEY